jgi:hypothetical protein
VSIVPVQEQRQERDADQKGKKDGKALNTKPPKPAAAGEQPHEVSRPTASKPVRLKDPWHVNGVQTASPDLLLAAQCADRSYPATLLKKQDQATAFLFT